jgi:hypothetical protein
MPENKRKKVFDSLINDWLKRKNKKTNLSIVKNEKKINQKKMDEIVTRLYSTKLKHKKK